MGHIYNKLGFYYFYMIQNKSERLSTIFRHLDGIVTAPVIFSLHERGVLAYLLEKKEISLQEMSSHFNANEGYLNVGLRVLCSQGWLVQQINNVEDQIIYRVNSKSTIAFSMVHLYKEVVELMKLSEKFHARKFEQEPFTVLEGIFNKYKGNYGLQLSEEPEERAVQEQILKHIEGMLVGPTVVMLGMKGMFHKYFMEASFSPEEFHASSESFHKILDFFVYLGWFTKNNGNYQFTDTGIFYAKRASAYGVTVSYIPTLRKVDELMFGDPSVLRESGKGEPEKHVDREMNVWGSGGAHSGYFRVIDEILIELFNKPIHEQPKGILDMGCGNGAFLEHAFEVIERQTARGKMLEQYPLFIVGADYNQASLKITRANLIQADIWAKVIWGDIGRPDLLAKDLNDNFGIDLKELLNVRTFLDHNRIWEHPGIKTPNRVSQSTGAFAFKGERISNNEVEDSLLEHLQKWAPYVEKWGLLLIELHTIPPALAAQNLGKTAATAYDATHGFSDQYIVEIEVFHKIAREAGLEPDMNVFRRFPDSELATVSINLLKGK
jgi:hypothetical protein